MSLVGKSLYILTPVYDGCLTINYHQSMNELVAICRNLNVDIGSNNVYNESLITRARNRMADAFLKETSFTHACFIDADIGFDPRDVIALLGMDKDIIGVPCTKKAIRWDRVQFAVARRIFEWILTNPCQPGANPMDLADVFMRSGHAFDSKDIPRIGGDFVLHLLPGTTNISVDQVNMKLEPVKRVGTGLLMVKREVFLKFMKAYPNRWYQASHDPTSNPGRIHDFFRVGINEESREYESEDFWFIHDCIELGYKALLAPWVRTTHMGRATFEGDLSAALGSTGKIF